MLPRNREGEPNARTAAPRTPTRAGVLLDVLRAAALGAFLIVGFLGTVAPLVPTLLPRVCFVYTELDTPSPKPFIPLPSVAHGSSWAHGVWRREVQNGRSAIADGGQVHAAGARPPKCEQVCSDTVRF